MHGREYAVTWLAFAAPHLGEVNRMRKALAVGESAESLARDFVADRWTKAFVRSFRRSAEHVLVRHGATLARRQRAAEERARVAWTCSTCRGPLPFTYAANINATTGERTCLGGCRPLYLFATDNPDWVVALDVEDARALWCVHLGERVENYADEPWERLQDDSKVRLWLDEETGRLGDAGERAVLTELTALEVINRFGRGFVATVDF